MSVVSEVFSQPVMPFRFYTLNTVMHFLDILSFPFFHPVVYYKTVYAAVRSAVQITPFMPTGATICQWSFLQLAPNNGGTILGPIWRVEHPGTKAVFMSTFYRFSALSAEQVRKRFRKDEWLRKTKGEM